MAEVSVKNSFETLYSVSKMNDSKRQVILRGSCPLLQNPTFRTVTEFYLISGLD